MPEKDDMITHGKSPRHLGRHAARLAAVQAIYQWEKIPCSTSSLVDEFITYRFAQASDPEHDVLVDQEFFGKIVTHTLENHERIDALIKQALPEGWPFLRLDSVLRSVLRAGCGEFLKDPSLAAAIVINEYVDIAKDYFDGKEPGFVNGILDRVARELDLTLRDDTKAKDVPAHEVEDFLKACDTTECITWEDEGGGGGGQR
ncbi:MAG: transcription antitermination factor NusB [Pseudomonadota bacterium]